MPRDARVDAINKFCLALSKSLPRKNAGILFGLLSEEIAQIESRLAIPGSRRGDALVELELLKSLAYSLNAVSRFNG